jgi:hypothetical protein
VLETGFVVLLERWGVDFDALGFDDIADLKVVLAKSREWPSCRETYAAFELGKIGWGEGVCLCDNWDQVDARAQTLHHFNIERLQGVAGGTDEVQARVHSEVDLLGPLWLLLLQHVALMLVVQELNDWLPAVPVVHVVSKSGCVNDRQADLEELLLQFSLGDLDLNSLVNLLRVASAVVGVVLDGGAEEGVDERGLSEAGLASNHDGKGSTALGDNLVALVGKLACVSVRVILLERVYDIH